MKLATWNVNSVRARLPRLLDWLRAWQPDILCLQETKVEDEAFPRELLEDEGYNVECHGERTYNGVAILARHRIEDPVRGLPGPDGACRLLAAAIGDTVVVDVYVPNGQALGTDKFAYKLDWLGRLRTFLQERYDPSDRIVVCGDFNVTFDDRDVWDPEGMRDQIFCSTAERQALQHVLDFGLHDALRKFHEEAGIHTWWDHRTFPWKPERGLRIDHVLVSGPALAVCRSVEVDAESRQGRGASDHAPVIAVFD